MIMGTIVGIADKFLDQEYRGKLVEVLKMTQIERIIREEGRIEGIAEGKAEGKVEGKAEGKMEVAKNMLLKNMPEDLIAEVTGLAVEQIRKLKEEIAGNVH